VTESKLEVALVRQEVLALKEAVVEAQMTS
jgi:hypothetical protein